MHLYLLSSTIRRQRARARARRLRRSLPGHCGPGPRLLYPASGTSPRRPAPPPRHSPPPPARHSPRRPRRHLCLEARLLPLARLRPSKGRDPPKQGETRAPARQFEHPVGRGDFPHSSWHRLQSSRNGSSCPGPAAASHTHSAGRTPFGSRFAVQV